MARTFFVRDAPVLRGLPGRTADLRTITGGVL